MRKLLVLLAAVAAVVVAASPAYAVLYGQPDNEEHPYVGVIRFFDEDGNYLWRCTGTLISPTVVLTAGHCTFGTAYAEAWFSETAPSTAEVLSGDYTRGITGETYTHPDYDDFATFPNTSDVGIVVLDQRVRLSTYGSLPTVGLADTLYKHELFTIVGYGVQDVQPVQLAGIHVLAGGRVQPAAVRATPQSVRSVRPGNSVIPGEVSEPKTAKGPAIGGPGRPDRGGASRPQQRQAEDPATVGPGWQDSGLVFTRPDGAPDPS